MKQEIGIYTETMAKVYATQGHWENAAAIYRRLLTEDPTRKDWIDALADAEKNLKTASRKNPEYLEPLFREWIELLFRNEKLRKLRKLRNKR
jgi:hypothetical protein